VLSSRAKLAHDVVMHGGTFAAICLAVIVKRANLIVVNLGFIPNARCQRLYGAIQNQDCPQHLLCTVVLADNRHCQSTPRELNVPRLQSINESMNRSRIANAIVKGSLLKDRVNENAIKKQIERGHFFFREDDYTMHLA